MMLNNFLYRVGDWLKRNRASVIKWAMILAVIAIAALLIYYGAERFHAWRYEKRVEAIEQQIKGKDLQINAATVFIEALKNEIAAKDALLEELDKQAGAAKRVVERTRTEYVYLKGEYEKTRDNPDIPVDISHCGACAELARAGHPCK